MSYTINRIFDAESFDAVVERTRSALTDQGFGVLTEIDVKATMKKKLDIDMDDYLILGACNPRMAHQAIGLEPRVGAMLPCNVIVRKTGPNAVEVSAVDPQASMEAIDNAGLKSVAGQVRDMLETVVQKI
ncbi:DUF302 domain-containing protein [Aurantimonas sp. C2-6-R+9]|uniref:DUF302 domain-containing protein n=1 Tax=unclassified Aurantimonas TaxID=2638230 RepID=UPI002E17116A|nr:MULTISPECIES: DUF302 domain-containing protein [unclassified Aurantimonas]MEC5292641.1 DUF302 domain-containing protein [Aurantimonas sp. C2-3-R2]MEC5325351.1 DUF302 domain-containing protein [Aurantimonas sp. A3-2-R12]MEC5382845.1 DUF302 domain-containing protein [Aurantimonas sp. C2-6-R+9]MEC5413696.1 DUF302 domain-containing protein [Aurantimonas sp. C2-4-R8]